MLSPSKYDTLRQAQGDFFLRNFNLKLENEIK